MCTEEKIKEFLRERFGEKFVDVKFLDYGEVEEYYPFTVDYMDEPDEDISYYVGYLVIVEGITVPFIAELYDNSELYVYLNPEKDFYLGMLIGHIDFDDNADEEEEKTERKGRTVTLFDFKMSSKGNTND